MKIGIVGTGNMGRSLGLVWAECGHEVFFGARNLEKAKAAAELSHHSTRYGTASWKRILSQSNEKKLQSF